MESGRALVGQWISRRRTVARTYTAAAGAKRATQHGAAVMTTSPAEQRNSDEDDNEGKWQRRRMSRPHNTARYGQQRRIRADVMAERLRVHVTAACPPAGRPVDSRFRLDVNLRNVAGRAVSIQSTPY